jgi:hypothetical protein
MNPNKETILALVIEAVRDNVPPERTTETASLDADSILFGPGGLLDSLALVNVVLDVEEGIRTRWGVTIALADEKAMSQSRSPFRRAGGLADYALQQLADAKVTV